MSVQTNGNMSKEVDSGLEFYATVANYGSLPVVNIVLNVEVGGQIDRGVIERVEPRDVRNFRMDFTGDIPKDERGNVQARVWIVFEDAEQHWWRKEEGRAVQRLDVLPPEVLTVLERASRFVGAEDEGSLG